MKPLWTPWRMAYILAIKSSGGCVFCEEVLAEGVDPDLVIHRGSTAFVVLNLYPYTTGHLMVVPYRHVPSMRELTPAELAESTLLLRRAELLLEEEYGMRRHHVGLNLGRCAGAGVEGHLHIHLVPGNVEDAGGPGPDGGNDPGSGDPPEAIRVTRERLHLAWSRRFGPSHGLPPSPHSSHSSAT